MKLVKALLLIAAVGAVNLAHADNETCLNREDAPRGDSKQVQTEKRTAEIFDKKTTPSTSSSTSS